MNYRVFILFSLIGNMAFAVNELPQNIEIANNSARAINLNLTVPEYTKAIVHMTQLSSKLKIIIDSQGMLHAAILNDSAAEIKEAVAMGAKINQTNNNKTPLLWAVLLKKENAVDALLELGAKPDKPLVQYAISLNAIRIASLLVLKGGIEINNGYNYGASNDQLLTLINIAIRMGDFDSANLLLKNGCAIPCVIDILLKFSSNPVAAAEVIQTAISRGYNVNNIWEASIKGPRSSAVSESLYDEQILELFTSKGANPNAVIDMNSPHRCSGGLFTWTPLFKAIESGKASAVRVLLDAKADVNQKANPISHLGSFTPLSWAIYKGMDDIVALLLEYDANL